MGQAVAEMVGVTAGENLCLGFQPAKRAGMNDAVAVTLEIVAVRMLGFREAAAARLFHPHGIIGQHGESLSQLQPHLASRLKAQGFVQCSPVLTGVKIDHCEPLLAAPLNHELHELA